MAGEKKTAPERAQDKKFSRRAFVRGSGTALAGGALAIVTPATTNAATPAKEESYPLSTRYLVYDSKHCAGCYGCMIACSMAHDGEVSFSLSRIQMHRAVLNEYPEDIIMHVCKQCPEPLCVKYCPTGACHVSAENGNIRMINAEKCIGCQTCIKMCPQTPHRTIWNPTAKKSTKCDLCTNTPFFNRKGGIAGAQACVEACPKQVIKVVDKLPLETGGYEIFIAPPPRPKMGFGPPGAKAKPATPEQAPKTPDPKQ
jgi:protein NrfC